MTRLGETLLPPTRVFTNGFEACQIRHLVDRFGILVCLHRHKLDVSYIDVVTPTCIAFGLFASAGFEGLLSYIPFGYLPGEGR